MRTTPLPWQQLPGQMSPPTLLHTQIQLAQSAAQTLLANLEFQRQEANLLAFSLQQLGTVSTPLLTPLFDL